MLVDYKGRTLTLGKRVRVEQDIPSADGMLYKHTIVKLNELNIDTKKVQVQDRSGKLWWIEPTQISCSFL